MIFPVVVYGRVSWTIKKAEHQRIDAFELWCWGRLFRVSWTSKRWNQSILKEISPDYSLEGLMTKLKLQYTGHLIQRTESLEKTLMLGKIEGGMRREPLRRRWLDGITDSMDLNLSKGVGDGQESLACCSPSGHRVRHYWATDMNWGLTALISLQPKGLSGVFSNTTVQKHQFFGAQLSLWSNSHDHTRLLEKSWLGKVMSLLFNRLSRLVIVFLPRSKHLLIPWLQS